MIILPLSDDDPKKWEYKLHTKVKHEILSKYLGTWINVLGVRWKTVCYFDCFAGRGKYEDGSEGSPIIALKTISDLKQNRDHIQDVVCTFIEKDKSNYDNLCKVVDAEISRNPNAYSSIIVKPPINDEFANVASEITSGPNKLAPSFFFIDPFGFGIPFKTIKAILSISKTEVFINFMVRDVNRFLNSPKHQLSIEDLFGLDDVMAEIDSNYSNLDKITALLKLYRKQLHENAGVKFTYPFKVNADDKLQTTYYLIHATNNLLGCEIMKEIMHNAGTKGRFGYLGPAEGQMALDNFADLSVFKNYLVDRFDGQTLSFEGIRIETVNETIHRKKDYQEALKELEDESKVFINGKGKNGGIKDESIVSFDHKIIEENNREENETPDNQSTLGQFQ